MLFSATCVAAVLTGIFSVQRLCFPYFWQDFFFLLKVIRYGVRLELYKKRSKVVTVMDRFVQQAERIPDKPFLIYEGCTYTYGEIDARSNRVARALQRYGSVKRGDTVALLMNNEPDFLCVWFGLNKLGCAVAFLNTNIKSRSLLHCFNSCGAKLLVAGAGKLHQNTKTSCCNRTVPVHVGGGKIPENVDRQNQPHCPTFTAYVW